MEQNGTPSDKVLEFPDRVYAFRGETAQGSATASTFHILKRGFRLQRSECGKKPAVSAKYAISTGATPSCARLALRRMGEEVEGTEPKPSLSYAPISVFDLRFGPNSFIFIYMMATPPSSGDEGALQRLPS
jgi:hypothetical protein